MYSSNNFVYETIDVVVRPSKTVYIGNEGLGRTIVSKDIYGHPVNQIITDIFSQVPTGFRRVLAWNGLTEPGNISILTLRSAKASVISDRIPLYVPAGEEFTDIPTATIPACNPVGLYDVVNLNFAEKNYLRKVQNAMGAIYQKTDGTTKLIPVSQNILDGASIVQRLGDGRINVAPPIDPNNATNKDYVDSTVKAAISSTYKIKGSQYANYFTKAQLDNEEVGNVYNSLGQIIAMPDVQFAPGTEGIYPTGTNLVVIEIAGVKYWDILAGTYDFSNYVTNTSFNNAVAQLQASINTKQNIIEIIS